MYASLKKHWYSLPLVSGALLVLTFHPFNVWPLGFFALAPLYWFAGGFAHPRKIIFWGGFITGGIFAFCLSYYTIVQFHWLPEAYLFVDVVRWLVVPITCIGGIMCGISVVCFAQLRGKNFLINAALAAALYTLAEILLGFLFGGYYLGLLAYAATPLYWSMGIAALGGAHLLSFSLAFIGGCAAEILIAGNLWKRALWRSFGPALLGVALVVALNAVYLYRPLTVDRSISVVIVQKGERENVRFGTQKNGIFSWSEGRTLAEAASSSPDLLIYPFAPVEGALYRDTAPAFNKEVLVAKESAVAAFFNTVIPASTTILTWNNLYASSSFYNEFELWQGGRVVSEYQKRNLFPFMDYTPAWAQHLGLFSTPFDVVAGAQDNHLNLGDVQLGDLMCSELHNPSLAEQEARQAPLIIAVGSEAMFQDDVASAFALRAAQLRAAENDVPVIRGNILGPSGIIDRSGRLIVSAGAGESAVISATIPLSSPRKTLYSFTGEWVVWALICGILLSAWHGRSLLYREGMTSR